jgi:hypothetical protein
MYGLRRERVHLDQAAHQVNGIAVTIAREERLNRGGISSLWKQHESDKGPGKPPNPVIAVDTQKTIASCLEPPSTVTTHVNAMRNHRVP